jgi:hypothetical protein
MFRIIKFHAPVFFGVALSSCVLSLLLFQSALGAFLAVLVGVGYAPLFTGTALWIIPSEFTEEPTRDRVTMLLSAMGAAVMAGIVVYWWVQ